MSLVNRSAQLLVYAALLEFFTATTGAGIVSFRFVAFTVNGFHGWWKRCVILARELFLVIFFFLLTFAESVVRSA